MPAAHDSRDRMDSCRYTRAEKTVKETAALAHWPPCFARPLRPLQGGRGECAGSLLGDLWLSANSARDRLLRTTLLM
ncbi:MAG: hypothetical protein DMF84_18165 [Acidobacteria bacterium]|nr:MAG: hypothetical protein DMF84_18165 [Acidobacteriota bacterium]